MKHEEDNLLIAIVAYVRAQYPKVLFTHIANERKTSVIQGARLKRKGVKAGIPDLLIFRAKGDWAVGLAVELKIKPNKPTASQQQVLDQLAAEGWQTRVCYTFDEAQNEIDNYLK
jgi:hypothetical protein